MSEQGKQKKVVICTRRSKLADKLQKNGFVCVEVQNVKDTSDKRLMIPNNKIYVLEGTVELKEIITNPLKYVSDAYKFNKDKKEVEKYFLTEDDLELVEKADLKKIEKTKEERLKEKAERDEAYKKRRRVTPK